MTKHTRGPWSLELRGRGAWKVEAIWNADNEVDDVAESVGAVASNEESHANARLISAAPEMLECLELCVEAFGTVWADVQEQDAYECALAARAEEAIAKAKGEA